MIDKLLLSTEINANHCGIVALRNLSISFSLQDIQLIDQTGILQSLQRIFVESTNKPIIFEIIWIYINIGNIIESEMLLNQTPQQMIDKILSLLKTDQVNEFHHLLHLLNNLAFNGPVQFLKQLVQVELIEKTLTFINNGAFEQMVNQLCFLMSILKGLLIESDIFLKASISIGLLLFKFNQKTTLNQLTAMTFLFKDQLTDEKKGEYSETLIEEGILGRLLQETNYDNYGELGVYIVAMISHYNAITLSTYNVFDFVKKTAVDKNISKQSVIFLHLILRNSFENNEKKTVSFVVKENMLIWSIDLLVLEDKEVTDIILELIEIMVLSNNWEIIAVLKNEYSSRILAKLLCSDLTNDAKIRVIVILRTILKFDKNLVTNSILPKVMLEERVDVLVENMINLKSITKNHLEILSEFAELLSEPEMYE